MLLLLETPAGQGTLSHGISCRIHTVCGLKWLELERCKWRHHVAVFLASSCCCIFFFSGDFKVCTLHGQKQEAVEGAIWGDFHLVNSLHENFKWTIFLCHLGERFSRR